MDYSALAAELLSFRTALHHLPAVRGLDEMSGGEYFVLHFLRLSSERQGRPS